MEKNKERILIIKTGYSEVLHLDEKNNSREVSFGDILRTTPLLYLYKNADVTWLTDEKAFPLLEGNPFISRLLSFDWITAEQLKKERFDTLINLEKTPGICIIADTIYAKRRYGFTFDPEKRKAQAYDNSAEILSLSSNLDIKKYNSKTAQELLFEMVGTKWNGQKYVLGYKPKTQEKYDIALNVIVGKKWPTKTWPKENWIKLKEMLEKDGFKVTKQDEQGKEVLENLYGYMDWINSAKLIVTPDTLGMHIAVALEKKVVSLFGPTPSQEAYFYGKGKYVLPKQKLDCMPCLLPECKTKKNCMENINVEEVYKEIRKITDIQKNSSKIFDTSKINKINPLLKTNNNLNNSQKTNTIKIKNSCRTCNSSHLQLAFKLEPTPPGDRYVNSSKKNENQNTYPIDIYLCPDCGLLQLVDVINPEILYGEYLYTTSISLGLNEHFIKYVDDIIKKVNPPKNSLIIDIGSNDGTLLRAFKQKGMNILGIDPAKEVAKQATASGIETIADYFTEKLAIKIRNEKGKAKIIAANNVIANVDDLTEVIKGIKELLLQDGVFVFETAYMPDIIQNNIFDNIYHEHLSYFGVKSINHLLSVNGLELIDIEHIDTKGGSMRGIAQLKNGPYTKSKSVVNMIDSETRNNLDKIEFFKNFDNRISYMKNELLKELKKLKMQGKIIAGYGASVGVTTIIYHFNLKDYLSFLLDDNPVRDGLFTPGFHIPVLSSKLILEKKPDYILILAWRYSKPIIQKNLEYLNKGGKFIIVDMENLEIKTIDKNNSSLILQ